MQIILALSDKIGELSRETLIAVGVSVDAEKRIPLAFHESSGEYRIQIERAQLGFVLNEYPDFFELVSPDELTMMARVGFTFGPVHLKSKNKVKEESADANAVKELRDQIRASHSKDQLSEIVRAAIEAGTIEGPARNWGIEALIDMVIANKLIEVTKDEGAL